MTDVGSLVLAAAAGVVALVTAWYHLPANPTLDGERWFKVWFATGLRGSADAEGATAEAWAGRVLRWVPYHPAGRSPERKVVQPEVLPRAPLREGEAALHQALAALPREERWAHLYDRDEVGLEARLRDPQDLGPDYDPAGALGVGVTWEVVARGGPALWGAMQKAGRATWILVGDGGAVPHPLSGLVLAEIGRILDSRAVRARGEGEVADPDGQRGEILARRGDVAHADRVLHLLGVARSAAPHYGDRLIFVGEGDGILVVLDALAASAPLRDQVEAVLSLGGAIQGLDGVGPPRGWEACTAWNQAFFRHAALDLESSRVVPYLAVQWLDRAADPPGAAGIPLDRARFPEPADPRAPRPAIEVVDLGPLPLDPELPVDRLAEALIGVTLGISNGR